MNLRLIDEIANAVLYEGYILYPYRPSSLKNRQRFNFGVVVPADDGCASAHGEQALLQTECLLRARGPALLRVSVRFLQLVDRTVSRAVTRKEPGPGLQHGDASADARDVDGRVFPGWQEAVEREISVAIPPADLISAPVRQEARWNAEEDTEILRTADGCAAATVVRRRKEAVHGRVDVAGALVDPGLFRITVRVSNITSPGGPASTDRDSWLMQSLVSTHAILLIDGGEFLSLVDPPADVRDRAGSCRHIGLWPVLVGEVSDRDALLASPIILYDYPQIAPESAGDFCDGTEIDEMLALRILTMTDDEKLEMREGDERARRMLERTEALSEEHMVRLHGVLRGLRSFHDEDAR